MKREEKSEMKWRGRKGEDMVGTEERRQEEIRFNDVKTITKSLTLRGFQLTIISKTFDTK